MRYCDYKYYNFDYNPLLSITCNNNFQILQGQQGPQGEKGDPGNDGITPNIGDNGNWWVGNQDTGIRAQGIDGENGKDGQDGVDGQDGKNGSDGIDGKSAYEIAVDNGFIGTEEEWLISLKGADGVNGQNGTNGENGKSAYEIAVEKGFVGTEIEWIASLKGKDGVDGKDGTPGLTPRLYHMDLSKVGNQIEIILDGIRAQYIYNDANSISFNIRSGSSNNVIVDLKRSTQYDGVASEGSTLDNFTLTPAYQSVDTIVYNSSREMHRTWIRTQDQTTGLWNLYQIDLFVSNKGARTDIMVYPIYTNANITW